VTREAFWRWALRGRNGDRRPWTAALAWPLAAGAAAVALLRVMGLEHGLRLNQLIAFAPYLGAGCIVAALASGLARRPVAAGTAALAAVALAACVLPRAFGSPATQPGTPLVVMSMNMRIGGADPKSIVDLVRSAHVDVLTLQEFSQSAGDDLDAAGLSDLLPYSERLPEWGAAGSAVLSRLPLTDSGVRWPSNPGFGQTYATVAVSNGARVVIESVHPVAPVGQGDLWASALRNQVRGDAGGTPRILAGDFNATLDHRLLRDLLATGYRDAAASVGAGFVTTWPYFGERATVTPKITLDHVLVPAGIGVRDFRAVTVPRTDHRAIIATLIVLP
jgi:endonuclease/exonuclease/phosphatase (EEP) superfamily protein YafD